MNEDALIVEQIAYYRARAAEYDEWHRRQGRYDRGEEHRRKWDAELGAVRSALRKMSPLGECLELACGTGLWTPDLAQHATAVTAIDATAKYEIGRMIAAPESSARCPASHFQMELILAQTSH